MISIELYTLIVKFMASGSAVQAQGRSKYCHLEKCKKKKQKQKHHMSQFFFYIYFFTITVEKNKLDAFVIMSMIDVFFLNF